MTVKSVKFKRLAALLLALLLGLTGCGGPDHPAPEGNPVSERTEESGGTESIQGSSGESEVSPYEEEGKEARGSYILKECNLSDPALELAKLQEEGTYYITFPFYLTQEGILYRNIITMDQESHTKQGQYFQKLDPADGSWTLTELPYPYNGEDGEYWIHAVYLYQGIPAFRNATDGEKVNYLAACDGSGNVEEILGAYPESVQSGSECAFSIGRAGNFYVYQEDGDRLLCLSRELEVMQEAKNSDHLKIRGVITDASEENVYWYGEKDGMTEIRDFQGNVAARAEVAKYGLDPLIEMGGDGRLYLATMTGLWELQGEEWELLCDFGLCDYPFSELYNIREQGDGSILLYGRVDGEDCLVRALEGTQTEREERQEMILALEDSTPSALLKSISRFNRQSDRYHITVTTKGMNESLWDYSEQLKLDIAAGKGPDILQQHVLWMWDPSSFIENGYFASLEGIIEDEDRYLPAAFEGGRTNGTLYGMPYDFMIHVAAYSEDLTGGRTAWTLQELMDAVEASDAEILQYGCSGVDIVVKYGLYDNDNTAYIDWEKGESHLTEEPFLELLEFAYRYQDPKSGIHYETELDEEMLQSGKAAAAYSQIYGREPLQGLDNAFGGKVSLIGYPRSEGSGIYAQSRYLYVNSRSGCMEGAAEFFRFLLSESEQSRFLSDEQKLNVGMTFYFPYFPVNLDSFRHLTEYWSSGSKGITQKQAEQVDFMVENARPDNWRVKEIQSILSEELEPYFAGDKTAEQAAELLHSRVQIYLDETR